MPRPEFSTVSVTSDPSDFTSTEMRAKLAPEWRLILVRPSWHHAEQGQFDLLGQRNHAARDVGIDSDAAAIDEPRDVVIDRQAQAALVE